MESPLVLLRASYDFHFDSLNQHSHSQSAGRLHCGKRACTILHSRRLLAQADKESVVIVGLPKDYANNGYTCTNLPELRF